MTRDRMLQALADMGIDTADLQIASMTDPQLQALLSQLNGEKFSASAKARFSAPPAAPAEDPRMARAKAIVDEAISSGKIRPDDGPVYLSVMSRLRAGANFGLTGSGARQFSAHSGGLTFEGIIQDLQSRPAGQFEPDAEFLRAALKSTPAGRGVMSKPAASAAARRTRTFSQVPADPDASFVERALRATPAGREMLAAGAA